jgi:hypothetical protein
LREAVTVKIVEGRVGHIVAGRIGNARSYSP